MELVMVDSTWRTEDNYFYSKILCVLDNNAELFQVPQNL